MQHCVNITINDPPKYPNNINEILIYLETVSTASVRGAETSLLHWRPLHYL